MTTAAPPQEPTTTEALALVEPFRVILSRQQREDADLASAALSAATRRTYRSQLRAFAAWSQAAHRSHLPASSHTLAEFLRYRAAWCDACQRQQPGGCHGVELAARPLKVASLRVAAAAVSFLHDALGFDDPAGGRPVRDTLRLLSRELGAPQGQAAALDTGAETAILGALNRAEAEGRIPPERATRDRALLLTMRDAMLRRSEAAALTWDDLEASEEEAGCGLLHVRRSKTDQGAEGVYLPLARETWQQLQRLRPAEPERGARVFGIGDRHIARRLRFLGELAGLDRAFSGHSPRVGMTHDLVKNKASLAAIKQAGRWDTERMPSRYAARLKAGDSATAALRRDQPALVGGPVNGEDDGGEA